MAIERTEAWRVRLCAQLHEGAREHLLSQAHVRGLVRHVTQHAQEQRDAQVARRKARSGGLDSPALAAKAQAQPLDL